MGRRKLQFQWLSRVRSVNGRKDEASPSMRRSKLNQHLKGEETKVEDCLLAISE